MSQREFLRQLDADIHAGLSAAGMVSTGTYLPPGGGAPVEDVRMYVDYAAEVTGEFGQVVGRRDEVAIFLADCDPVVRGRVVADGETLELSDKIDQDPSLARFIVRKVAP